MSEGKSMAPFSGKQIPDQLATPLFTAIYQRFGEQPRLDQVQRLDAPASREQFLNEIHPAGCPVVFPASGIRITQFEVAMDLIRHKF